ncbi:MAG: hypothetical protein V4820_05085 [Pseudomonadota bacterium]
MRAKPRGGDKRSARIYAHAALILGLVEAQGDITLVELRARLAQSGIAVAVSTLWRFFERRAITLKKSPGTRPSRIVPTS